MMSMVANIILNSIFVNNCEVTHKLHDSYGEADISVHADRYNVSLSTVDILISCFHDTLDNSINYLVFIHNNCQNVFKGFYFLKVHSLTGYMTLVNCLCQPMGPLLVCSTIQLCIQSYINE